MVKKKAKSKRTTLQDKYKIQRKTVATHRKRRKQAKKDIKAGKVIPKRKDPGIPNSWPFKQDLLKDIQRARERQQEKELEKKDKRKAELRALKEHQEQGGTARTVQELMEQANRDQKSFEDKEMDEMADMEKKKSDGTVAAGQQSRRAYLRELKKVVDTADVLLQVLDARDPVGTRINDAMENVILSRADKRMVLVLNKIDLVPKEVLEQWLAVLRRSHPAIAVTASNDRSKDLDDNASATSSTTFTTVGMDGLLQLMKNYARTGGAGGKSKTTIVVGVIGYPNVGKSSIINALKRTRAVGVSPRPGFTTSMQEVVLDKTVRLLDSPGVVFDDKISLLGNCVDAESVEDPIPAVEALLNRCNHSSLIMAYNIPAFPPGEVMMFLALVARAYGRVLKGGIPDKMAAARAVLKDWNNGKIPYYTPAPENKGPVVKTGDVAIVSQLGEEFDLAKYDEEVMKTLSKKQDEMDFVQLKEGNNNVEMATDDSDVVNFLKNGDDNDDDDDDEMEEDSDDDDDKGGAQRLSKEKIAQAEDYDFDDL